VDGSAAFVTGERPAKWPSGPHYRNCWWVRDPKAPFLVAAGIYGQNIYVLPADDLVVAKFSTWPTPLSPPFEDLTIAAVDALAEALR
jgi:CubicO group peptidase (beta-lactamase class C family)